LLWGQSLIGQYFIDDPSNQFPTNITYLTPNSLTNTLSYSLGMRQLIGTQCPNGVAILDTSHPQQIPPGATLNVACFGTSPALLFLSSEGPLLNPLTVNPGDSLQFQWANGAWNLPGVPPTPQNFRVIQQ
jgi:hypothetical protein